MYDEPRIIPAGYIRSLRLMRLLAVCCTHMTYCSITPGVLNENAKANES